MRPRGSHRAAIYISAFLAVCVALFALSHIFFSKPDVSYTRSVTVVPTPSPLPQPTATPTIPVPVPVPAPVSEPVSTSDHVATPEAVKAIYMSQCAAGTQSFRADLVGLIDSTELNAIVIDIKDFSGGIAFPTDDPILSPYVSTGCGAKDMKAFVKELHSKNIYVIGRITVFQDPLYVKAHPEFAVKTKEGGIWHNNGGLPFIDVGARPFWDYIVELSKVSYQEEGFDELNFDYVRFPSDGPLSDADFTFDVGKSKSQAVEEFFQYLHAQLKPTGVMMSADLFGLAAVNHDDLGIGQVLERAMPYFDFVAPMVYPSHFSAGFDGIKDVNSDPYTVVHYSMAQAVARAAAKTTSIGSLAYTRIGTSTPALYEKPSYPASKIRPWLQSFDYPVPYTPEMVKAQIKAAADAGVNSWFFWDAANRYRSLKQVVS